MYARLLQIAILGLVILYLTLGKFPQRDPRSTRHPPVGAGRIKSRINLTTPRRAASSKLSAKFISIASQFRDTHATPKHTVVASGSDKIRYVKISARPRGLLKFLIAI